MLRVGEIEVLPVSDGTFSAPEGFLAPAGDLAAHAELLDADGVLRLPVGCFVVRTGDTTVLVDTGAGTIRSDLFDAGHLLASMAAIGVAPADVDVVVCSHLHLDHCGGLVDDEAEAVFPNATLRVDEADWRMFVVGEAEPTLAEATPVVGFMRRSVREGLRRMSDAGRVEPLDGDEAIARGVTTLAAPGHTPGHRCVVVSSGADRALLLGDAITCPVQLDETEWAAMSDVDPELARRTRERLWQELEGEGTVGAGAHFPDLAFGRVLSGSGRRWWA